MGSASVPPPALYPAFSFRPRKRLEKRRKRSHTNVSNASVTRTSRIFQAPLQTPLPCFHQWVSRGKKWSWHNRLQNGPRLLSLLKSGKPLGFRRKIAHKGTHGETGGVLGGGWYHYPRTAPHVSETLRGQGVERQTLPLLGLGRVCSRRTQKAFGTAMRSCASLFRRRRGPAGPRDLFTFVEIAACMPCSRYFFRFSRRSSLCRSCASCVSARFFSARSSMVFGRNRQDFLL